MFRSPDKLGADSFVLVVDDEPAMLGIIEATLTSAGYSVTVAGNGFEALEKAQGINLGLAVVDLIMPKMSGAETIRNLRMKRPKLPVLVVTGLSSEEARATAPEANAYLHKPFLIGDLLRAVDEALEAASN